MERRAAATKVHVENTDQEVAGIFMAECLGGLVPTELHADFQRSADIVLSSDVQMYISDQADSRLMHDADDVRSKRCRRWWLPSKSAEQQVPTVPKGAARRA